MGLIVTASASCNSFVSSESPSSTFNVIAAPPFDMEIFPGEPSVASVCSSVLPPPAFKLSISVCNSSSASCTSLLPIFPVGFTAILSASNNSSKFTPAPLSISIRLPFKDRFCSSLPVLLNDVKSTLVSIPPSINTSSLP